MNTASEQEVHLFEILEVSYPSIIFQQEKNSLVIQLKKRFSLLVHSRISKIKIVQ